MSNYEPQIPKRRNSKRRIRANRRQKNTPNNQPTVRRSGSFLSGLISGLFGFIAFLALSLGALLIAYAVIVTTQDLPRPDELDSRRSQFQSTRIFDREGNLLNETFGSS